MAGKRSFLQIPIDDLVSVFDGVGSRWEQLRNKSVFLTGGTGFIGKWLLATFLYANRRLDLSARIVVLSRQPDRFLQEFPDLVGLDDVVWLNGDVRNLAPESANGCNFAIHAATDVVASNTPSDILETCVQGTRRVLDAMKSGTCNRRLLLLSSGAIYGRTPPELLTIPEGWPGAPDPTVVTSAYGEGKRVSELLCAMAAAERPGLDISIARCFAFVGPHLPLDKHFAIGNFIGAAMRGEEIKIQGDGTPLRSYLYTSDLARWLWVMLFDAPNGRAYNVGGAESLSIRDLAYRVNNVLEGTGKILIAQTPSKFVARQSYVPSLARIAEELDLVPSVGIDDAIRKTAHWAMQNSESNHE